LGLIYFKKASF